MRFRRQAIRKWPGASVIGARTREESRVVVSVDCDPRLDERRVSVGNAHSLASRYRRGEGGAGFTRGMKSPIIDPSSAGPGMAGPSRRRKRLRALITGLTGFAGSHLAEYLVREHKTAVFGLSLSGECLDDGSPICEGAEVFASDICDAEETARLVGKIRPDRIYHLAALASVASSWSNPAETLTNNMVAQLSVLEAALRLDPLPRVLIVGSGDEYGLVRPDELPVREDNALRPGNPYAVSKIAQDYLGYQYFVSRGLPVVRVRPFNHIGPRQQPGFVVPDFSHQIAQAEAGLREPVMKVGNLSAERDFTDVRDMVRGYYLALECGELGEVYNLGRGEAHSIGEVLDTLLSMSRIDISVEPDPARMRPSDVPRVVCDATRFRQRTGWEPEIPLRQSLLDVLGYWRARAAYGRA